MKVIDTERIPIKMWLDDPDEGTLEQALNLARLPFAYRWIALMPDAHKGYGMPVGGVMATEDGILVPHAVGVDIGCGMIAARTPLREIDEGALKQIMGKTRELVPLGFAHQAEAQQWEGFDKAPDLKVISRELQSARKQLGTLGGGNHFIEIQQGDDGYIWLMIHSGSRNFGLKVAGEYHGKAKLLCARWWSPLSDQDLAFLPISDQTGHDYYDAMNFCLDFARENRARMMSRLSEAFRDVTGARPSWTFDVHHNYAAFEHHWGRDVVVHRKGATRARDGEYGIIPGSMGSASYIVQGKGNPESFQSCSHGAGRRMGRKEAKRSLDLETEQAKMAGIVHGLRTPNDLDEAPGAYKDIEAVMTKQADLVNIVTKLRPLASIKG